MSEVFRKQDGVKVTCRHVTEIYSGVYSPVRRPPFPSSINKEERSRKHIESRTSGGWRRLLEIETEPTPYGSSTFCWKVTGPEIWWNNSPLLD